MQISRTLERMCNGCKFETPEIKLFRCQENKYLISKWLTRINIYRKYLSIQFFFKRKIVRA